MRVFLGRIAARLAATIFFAFMSLGAAAAPGLAAEGPCLAGDLDDRFCDRDGDLVADPPTDPAEWLDPDPIVFAYTPVEDPAVYRAAWSDFLDHLAAVTGRRIVFFPVQSNAAQIEAMRSGRLHVAGFNTGSNPLAVNCAGFVPVAMMAASDGSYGYEMEIITYPGSGIESIEDIRGRRLAFTAPTSNSGFKAPSAILAREFGLVGERDFESVFSGKHDNSILGVVNRDYDAAAVANSVKDRMVSRAVIDAADIRVLYRSRRFPTTGFGHVYNLAPALAEKVRTAFLDFDWAGTSLLAEFEQSGESQFIPITYKEHWAVIREIDAANRVSYACR